MPGFRSRWTAVGAAVAVSLGVGGVGAVNADLDAGDRPVTITVEPERILDTRSDLGLAGRFVSQSPRDLQVTGSVAVASGGTATVVPTGALAVLVNVTVVFPDSRGFLSLRNPGATGVPTTSTVNFTTGSIEPNAATVDLGPGGRIQVYVMLEAKADTADVLVDVVGYTVGHNHDDRYGTRTEVDGALATKADTDDVYTKAQIDGALATKADTDDVYTMAESEAIFLSHGEITLSHATANMSPHGPGGLPPTTALNFADGTVVSGDGIVTLSLVGPAVIGAVEYGLASIEYCIVDVTALAKVGVVWVEAQNSSDAVEELVNSTAAGCYTVTTNLTGAQAYGVEFLVDGGAGEFLTFAGVQSTWAPSDTL